MRGCPDGCDTQYRQNLAGHLNVLSRPHGFPYAAQSKTQSPLIERTVYKYIINIPPVVLVMNQNVILF